MDAREQATRLYAALPHNLRERLYQAVMADPEMPFRDGPDDSYAGRWFIISTGNYTALAAQQALDAIIEQFPAGQRQAMYQVYVRHLTPLVLQALRARRPANPLSQNANAVAYRRELTELLGAQAAAQELANPDALGAEAMNRRGQALKAFNNARKGGRRSTKRRKPRKN